MNRVYKYYWVLTENYTTITLCDNHRKTFHEAINMKLGDLIRETNEICEICKKEENDMVKHTSYDNWD